MNKAKLAKTVSDDADQINLLKASPIHGIEATGVKEIELDNLDGDETNPGIDQFSKRYERRAPDIRESFDILGRIVYPLVVCENPSASGRYIIVDGHGRSDEARRRGVNKLQALIYPALTLEQRICLREVLNAAQRPFDTPLVLKDLHLLARERNLDISNDNDLNSLLADLPQGIRKQKAKLKMLSKLPKDLAEKISVDENDAAGVIGMDKVKELDRLVNVIRKKHPDISKAFAGEKLYRQAFNLYFGGVFRDGNRSQDAIRRVIKMVSDLPSNHAAVQKFVKGVMGVADFKLAAEADLRPTLVDLCKDINSLLTDIDSKSLTEAERRSLKRTADLASQVLTEV